MPTNRRRLIILAALAALLVIAAVAFSDEFALLGTAFRSSRAPAGGSPVGSWQQAGGASLVLNAEGEFAAGVSTGTILGTWAQSGRRLCLTPLSGGDETACYRYTLQGDMMTLDAAVYIRAK